MAEDRVDDIVNARLNMIWFDLQYQTVNNPSAHGDYPLTEEISTLVWTIRWWIEDEIEIHRGGKNNNRGGKINK